MSEHAFVENPFLDQLAALDWQVTDQGPGVPTDPTKSFRTSFREVALKDIFKNSVRAINLTATGQPWLTDKQLDDLYDELLNQPSRSLIETNEAVQKLLYRAQVDVNEVTGEQYPNVKLIDFDNPERNHFLAINQFRIDTPGSGIRVRAVALRRGRQAPGPANGLTTSATRRTRLSPMLRP